MNTPATLAAPLGVFAATLAIGCALGACSPPPPSAALAPPIAKTWKARCGACHTRVEPGSRTRAQLEVALGRHGKRVKLTEMEWREMVAFLASEPPRNTAQPSPPPEVAPFAPASESEPAPAADAGAP